MTTPQPPDPLPAVPVLPVPPVSAPFPEPDDAGGTTSLRCAPEAVAAVATALTAAVPGTVSTALAGLRVDVGQLGPHAPTRLPEAVAAFATRSAAAVTAVGAALQDAATGLRTWAAAVREGDDAVGQGISGQGTVGAGR